MSPVVALEITQFQSGIFETREGGAPIQQRLHAIVAERINRWRAEAQRDQLYVLVGVYAVRSEIRLHEGDASGREAEHADGCAFEVFWFMDRTVFRHRE